MKRTLLSLAAASLSAAALVGVAAAQTRDAEALRASGAVGELADGFMACRTTCDAATMTDIRTINEQRAAVYRQTKNGTAEAAGASSFVSRLNCTGVPQKQCIKPGQWYRPAGGGWTTK